jgi:uncharacterized 2Fe-2S/4Fe-4S cluster protein (DUF4445 family)
MVEMAYVMAQPGSVTEMAAALRDCLNGLIAETCAEISCGQRAAPGAIERLRIDRDTLEPIYQVIGCELWSNEPGFEDEIAATGVTGICGSGIIEALGEMYLAGLIHSDGALNLAAEGRSKHLPVRVSTRPGSRNSPNSSSAINLRERGSRISVNFGGFSDLARRATLEGIPGGQAGHAAGCAYIP